MVVVANGSPYHTRQQAARRAQVRARARETGLAFRLRESRRRPGRARLRRRFVRRRCATARSCSSCPAWHETLALVTLDGGVPKPVRGVARSAARVPRVRGAGDGRARLRRQEPLSRRAARACPAASIRRSSLAIAVDALGRDRVRAVMMPSPYTRAISLEDARAMAGIVGVRYDEIPIEPMFEAFRACARRRVRRASPPDAAEENIQARIRGTLLMALSNKFGSIVLTTGNKSEMAVGYATLYGDMAGGFGVLKDISKTLVYRLCALPQRPRPRDPRADHHARAVGGAARRPDRPGLAAALRCARRHSRGLRRAGPEPGGDRGDGLCAGARARRSCGSSRSTSTSGGRRRSASGSRRAASARTGAIRSPRRGTSGKACAAASRRASG